MLITDPITIRNIYFCGADVEEPTLGAATLISAILSKQRMDGSTNIVDGCYFEWMGGDGAAFKALEHVDVNLTFTNNMIFNNGGSGWNCLVEQLGAGYYS